MKTPLKRIGMRVAIKGMKIVNAGAKIIKWHQTGHVKKQERINKYGRSAIGS